MIDVDEGVREMVHRFMEEQIPFNRLLGMKIETLERGYARMTIPFREELIGDPWRPALHGGVISALVDTCGGAAVFSLFDDVGDRTSTVDLRVDYLRPGRKETLVAKAQVSRAGNRVAAVDIVVFHPGQEDAPIATGKGVYNVRRAKDQAETGDPSGTGGGA